MSPLNAQNNAGAPQPLDAGGQSLVSISALTATGDLTNLKTALGQGLDAGLTINEIKEALVQLYAYCGFPRSLNGLTTFMAVLDGRKVAGKTDVIGKEATPVEDGAKYATGKKTLETLTKTLDKGPTVGVNGFAPAIDTFLKEHLFADIFSRDVLTFSQRELVTIAALSSMTGVESQLQAHLKMGMNTGLTEAQLLQVADLIQTNVGKARANSIRTALSKPTAPLLENGLLVRIAELDIVPDQLNAYVAILNEEAATSVKIEPGVLGIFPMQQTQTPTQIRIVEIYGSQEAYQSHLKTPHFQRYKTATTKLVKSLKLVDMKSLDADILLELLKKVK